MAKFPDPTRDYAGAPVDPNKPVVNTPPVSEVPVYQAPHIESPQATREVPPDAQQSGRPEPSTVNQYISPSPFRNIIPIVIGVAVLAILAVLGFTFVPKLFKKTTSVTLTYWGLWEPSSVVQSVIAEYEAANPNVKIKYEMQSPKNYRSRLQSAISSGTGPDIVRIHNTWLPMLRSSLTPAPEAVVPATTLDAYYPIVKKNASVSGKIYALPLGIDGLALFYNEDMLKEAGATPPADWNTLRKLAYDLKRINPETKAIERAGAAIGTTSNVDHWSDILGLLIMQNSGDPSKPSTSAVQDALTFYTIFSTEDKSWDANQPKSVYAFATGSVAMILAPSWEIPEIKAINPDLRFGVAPAPTLATTKVAWGSYWMEAVPKSSANSEEAWKFIKYLSSDESLQKMYAGASQIHVIGEPYPKTSMSSLLSNDPLVSPFVTQAPNYSSWYLTSRTFDEGLNDQLIKYYEDAVNGVNSGSTVATVVKTLDEGVTQILSKFPEAK